MSFEYDDGREHYKRGGSIHDDLTWDERRGYNAERDFWENIHKPTPTSSLPSVFDWNPTSSSNGSSSSSDFNGSSSSSDAGGFIGFVLLCIIGFTVFGNHNQSKNEVPVLQKKSDNSSQTGSQFSAPVQLSESLPVQPSQIAKVAEPIEKLALENHDFSCSFPCDAKSTTELDVYTRPNQASKQVSCGINKNGVVKAIQNEQNGWVNIRFFCELEEYEGYVDGKYLTLTR